MILMLAMIGQLSAQVNASHCMLDFINSYVALATLYVALAIEFSGILHSAYLIRWMVEKLARRPATSTGKSSSGLQRFLFAGRIVLSLCILGFALAVTMSALFQGKTTMWPGVPEVVSVLLFLFLMSVVGMLEGAQIAFFAVAKLDKSELGSKPVVTKTCELLFRGDGHNLPGFMIGRQILVTMCFFIIARVTTLNVDAEAGEETIFGVSPGVQDFFNTGLLGAIITTTVGSITWQLVASVFPVAFMHNPLVYVLLRICLFLEFTGVCSGAWVLASCHKYMARFQRDEFYLDCAGSDSKVDVEVGSNVGFQPGADSKPSLGTDPGTFHMDPAKYISEACPSTIGKDPQPSASSS